MVLGPHTSSEHQSFAASKGFMIRLNPCGEKLLRHVPYNCAELSGSGSDPAWLPEHATCWSSVAGKGSHFRPCRSFSLHFRSAKSCICFCLTVLAISMNTRPDILLRASLNTSVARALDVITARKDEVFKHFWFVWSAMLVFSDDISLIALGVWPLALCRNILSKQLCGMWARLDLSSDHNWWPAT